MIHDGDPCNFRESRVFGWRHGNPETDVNLDGLPIKDNYVVIVRIADCPKTDDQGRLYYNPKGVKQAFPISHGGTAYGYGKSQIVRNGQGRHVRVYQDGKAQYEWLCTYVKTPMYVVRDGRVYVGACYRALRAGEK